MSNRAGTSPRRADEDRKGGVQLRAAGRPKRNREPRMKFATSVAGVVLLSACTGNGPRATDPDGGQPTATATVDVQPQPTAPTTAAPTAAPGAADPAGSWSSASCGKRTYVRELTLAGDGTFSARDLVSPCPPNAKCVWSGIVDRSGKWKLDGSKVLLTVEKGTEAKAGESLPSE